MAAGLVEALQASATIMKHSEGPVAASGMLGWTLGAKPIPVLEDCRHKNVYLEEPQAY
jgi:hypothetical protein